MRDAQRGSGAVCRDILGELPEWFGIEESVQHYTEAADQSLTVVATVHERAVGFMTLVDHGPYSSEILVMGVRPSHHRRGVGRRLVARAEALVARRGAEYLQVKTLSGRRLEPRYAATRAFYTACGFRPLEELTHLWDEANPALQLVKRVDPGTRAAVMEHLTAFNSHDTERLLGGLAEDVEWVTGTDRFRGRAELATVFDDWLWAQNPRLEVVRMAVDGSSAAAEGVERMVVEGRPLSVPLSVFFEVRDGRLSSVRVYREGTADLGNTP